jgi:hypothetical protein
MRSGVYLMILAVPACTLFTPFGTDLTSGNVEADAALEASANDADTGVRCDPTVRTLPLRAFDATMDPKESVGPACSVDDALVEDGRVAGLDRSGTLAPTLDGEKVTACVGVEMPLPLASITVRVGPVAKGCTSTCGACGTGHSFKVFAGPTMTALSHLGHLDMPSTSLTNYSVEVPATVEARFVVVCRAEWGLERDDVGVDAIHGRCR